MKLLYVLILFLCFGCGKLHGELQTDPHPGPNAPATPTEDPTPHDRNHNPQIPVKYRLAIF